MTPILGEGRVVARRCCSTHLCGVSSSPLPMSDYSHRPTLSQVLDDFFVDLKVKVATEMVEVENVVDLVDMLI